MKSSEVLSGGVFFLFGAATTILATQMPIGSFRAAGSGLFPLCLGIFLMLLSAGLMVKVLFLAKEHEAEQTEVTIAEDACAKKEPGSLLPVVIFLAIMGLAALFLPTLGYLVVSFLLMAGLLATLGLRRWPMILVLSLVTAAGSHVLFVYLLRIPLPKGFLGI
jgi:putative tricarboxylic transport membrane protein